MNDLTRGIQENGPAVARQRILRSAQDLDCYGIDPDTREPCVPGDHIGHHETVSGRRWLDDD